jgi:hypothetical protein
MSQRGGKNSTHNPGVMLSVVKLKTADLYVASERYDCGLLNSSGSLTILASILRVLAPIWRYQINVKANAPAAVSAR